MDSCVYTSVDCEVLANECNCDQSNALSKAWTSVGQGSYVTLPEKLVIHRFFFCSVFWKSNSILGIGAHGMRGQSIFHQLSRPLLGHDAFFRCAAILTSLAEVLGFYGKFPHTHKMRHPTFYRCKVASVRQKFDQPRKRGPKLGRWKVCVALRWERFIFSVPNGIKTVTAVRKKVRFLVCHFITVIIIIHRSRSASHHRNESCVAMTSRKKVGNFCSFIPPLRVTVAIIATVVAKVIITTSRNRALISVSAGI